jgi:hypothetical protein
MDYVSKEYHEFLPLFSEAVVKALPPHRSYDHKISLHERFTPPFRLLYLLSKIELQTLKDWLEENLDKRFVRASFSPVVLPILFVKKGDGSLYLYVDYRGLNERNYQKPVPSPATARNANTPLEGQVLHNPRHLWCL